MDAIFKWELEKFYVKERKSSTEIAKIFDCSQHKIDYWIRKHRIPKRSISEAIYQKRNRDGDPFKIKTISNQKEAVLLGLGLGLYWGEGNKKNKNSIRLGNTDPRIIRKFIEFLLNILGVHQHKIRLGLQIFSDMSKKQALEFWLKELSEYGINRSQFFKVIVTPARSIGTYREKSQYGVLTVYFCNTKLKKILDSMLPL
ncbi:MAG: hypothetical protein A3C88_01135 [Candidatus Yanofskybacteria bacterium RIFCSPHIGHO2_02_FULL_50_12]|uniref:Homing endonuclease LAGLIDADG domain-containing protein n=1 Tax=Candidatus Yanofskybacteria bacterium RIFCSPHIGHO2_02_FULL_50_12 TaxID=1802685 RepID=A0A1F8FWG5_9BACT|nr:MAG: hypothetical protein A3C88_01135 [Candidatus Yanofskybacteria bacterium RIFCSPHIGHO2_02_FULL_50_12]